MIKKTDLRLLTSESAIISYMVIIKILIHLLLPEYGYHRDEYFYIAIADQFSFNNLDMLPLTPLFLKLFTAIFGYSLKSLHFASALCGAISLYLTCLITRALGGKKYAILLTGLFVLFSGFIIFGSIFTYDSLDFLIWVSALYILVRMFKENNPKLWIPMGIIIGFGLLNKLTIVFLGLAIFVCLWLVPQRAYFRNRWLWIAGLIAMVFSTPFLIWQSQHNWYFLDFAANYAGGISYVASFPEFLWNQILPNNFVNFPIAITGLFFLLFHKKWERYRFFAFVFIFLFFLFYSVGAKFYFLIPLYTILLSIGSIKIEELIYHIRVDKAKTKIIKIAFPIIYIILSIPLLPMVVPVLPIEKFIDYAAVLGVDAGVKYENQQLNQLPQHIADRFGWEEMVEEVAKTYKQLPESERKKIGIVTGNWGQASAIHFYRDEYDLPEPVTLEGWYYFETLRTHEFKDRYISIGIFQEGLNNIFEEVDQAGFFTHPYCMPHENNKAIFVCRRPKFDLKKFWMVERQIDPNFLHVMETNGIRAAINYYQNSKKRDPSILLFSERQINALGYEYLGKGKLQDAIALFQLNVEVYPTSSNVYDSLGEGYLEIGEYELAIEYYKKSFELNPNNTNAKKKLKEIESLIH